MYYAAIRKTEGREWIDISSIGITPFEAEDKARYMEDRMPWWAKDNKRVRIGKIEIIEKGE